MLFSEQPFKGLFLIESEPFIDHRGVFTRHYCVSEYRDAGLDGRVAQCNISETINKQTLRGFHYLFPFVETKTMVCVHGSIHVVIVDVRPNSETYRQNLSFELSSDNRLSLQVPPGCANAYLTLQDDVKIFYMHSVTYDPSREKGFRYNDPYFSIEWPAKPMHISQKDAHYPDFVPLGESN